jgi:glycine amidinotransferase
MHQIERLKVSQTEIADESTDEEVADNRSTVCSHNEWDPLEEVIVGRVEGAAIPPWHVTLQSTAPKTTWNVLKVLSGSPALPPLVEKAQQELDGFLAILDAEGITVRRPDPLPQTGGYSTPDWTCEAAYNIANPRDLLMVIGDEIVETPMAWRSRYFEPHAYRNLLHEYFRSGARWVAAPKPRLEDSFYNDDYEVPEKGEPARYAINETECTFDAADFTRCGRDLFVTQSNVTNEFGIEWLRRHLGEEYTIHPIETRSRQPMHIDTTFIPLAPGKALYNPEYIDPERLPKVLSSWELRPAPKPAITPGQQIDMSSAWLTMNVVMLDPRKVVVEAGQAPLIKMLSEWGFDPIPCPYQNYYYFGGGFHCSTLDIRRRGTLESYF